MLETGDILDELQTGIKYMAFPALDSEGSTVAYKSIHDAMLEPKMVYGKEKSEAKRATTVEMRREAELDPTMLLTSMVPIGAPPIRYRDNTWF